MRTFTTLVAAIALLLSLSSCGGRRAPETETGTVQGEGVVVGQPDTEITEDDFEVVDEGVGVGEEGGITERPLSDMTIEEINAAEFLRNIYFDFDRYDLRDDAIDQLEQNAAWLREHPTVRVIIEGHCDERDTEEYNLALGERRANAARDYFIRVGIAPSRLMTVSYGESRPIDPGHNEAAWARNRRAHFRIFER